MNVEEIMVNGQRGATLRELLRPGLKAVFIGLNPAPVSVSRGHYYQGRLGLRFWDRLQKSHIVPPLPRGTEDDAAFACGYGLTDLVRRPTPSSKELTKGEKSVAIEDLGARLSRTGDHPLIIFTLKEPWIYAWPRLEQMGYHGLRMPGPFEDPDTIMKIFRARLNSEGTNIGR